jgi:hypothetical protein
MEPLLWFVDAPHDDRTDRVARGGPEGRTRRHRPAMAWTYPFSPEYVEREEAHNQPAPKAG